MDTNNSKGIAERLTKLTLIFKRYFYAHYVFISRNAPPNNEKLSNLSKGLNL